MSTALLQPAAVLMLLTLCVWLYMYVRRFSHIIQHRIPAPQLATPEDLNRILPEAVNRPSNNLKNLFELPVLFYALCVIYTVMQWTDPLSVNLAWSYVALRMVHSVVHCSINIVPARFAAYALSSVVLWIMVIRFALQVFA